MQSPLRHRIEIAGNRQIFEARFSATRRRGETADPYPGYEGETNLEPSTRRVFGNNFPSKNSANIYIYMAVSRLFPYPKSPLIFHKENDNNYPEPCFFIRKNTMIFIIKLFN